MMVLVVGSLGIINTLLFLAYATKRIIRLRVSTLADNIFRRKLWTHRLLFLTGLVDLPMFIYFIIQDNYNQVAYAVHLVGKIGLLVALGLVMDEWCSVLYMNTQLQPRPWYLSRTFLTSCITLASCCIFVNAYLVATIDEIENRSETVYEALLVAFVFTTVGLCMLTLYTAYELYKKLVYLGDIANAAPHQIAMRNASSRLLISMNILLLCTLIQVSVAVFSVYSPLKPTSTKIVLVLSYWFLTAYIPLWGTGGILLSMSGIRPKPGLAPRSPQPIERLSEDPSRPSEDQTDTDLDTDGERRTLSLEAQDGPDVSLIGADQLRTYPSIRHNSLVDVEDFAMPY